MNSFFWTKFYEAFADNLLGWKEKRRELFDLVRGFAANHPLLGYLHFDRDEMWKEREYEIDPFTIMGIFNRGTTAEHRQQLGTALAEKLGVKDAVAPDVFHGIPHLDPRKSIYDGNDEMWELFMAALDDSAAESGCFAKAWDKAAHVRGNALATLSIGLFWMRPFRFMAVDKISAPWIEEKFGLKEPAEKCSGAEYMDYLSALERNTGKAGMSFPAIALNAWQSRHGG